MSNMNPQITTVQVGVKSLREVTIYPLSMADQFAMTDLIKDEFNNIVGTDFSELSDMEVTEMVVDAVKRNLTKLLGYVIDENEEVSLDELTNTQFADIAMKIYEMNFDVFEKNWKTLKQKFPSLGSLSNVQSPK